MISVSGTVRDYNTSIGISGAQVYSMGPTDFNFFDSVTSSGGGKFNINIPSSGTQVIYLPYKQGYKGYSRQLLGFVDDVDLFLRSGTSAPPSASGAVFASLVDAVLTTSNDVIDVKTTPCHAIAITSAGVDIFDPDTKTNIGYVARSGGYSAVYVDPDTCNEVQVYLGTSTSGLLRLDLEDNTGNLEGFVIPSYGTLSLDIRSIKGNSSGNLVIGSSIGVDIVTSSGIFSHNTGVSVEACLVNEAGDVYYSPVGSGVYVKYGPIGSSWTVPDYILDSSSTPSLLSNTIHDIETVPVVSGNDYVFLATSSGVNTYEEDRTAITGSLMNSFTTELSSTTLNVTGLEVHEGATYNSGSITYSTLENEFDGVVGILNLASGVVTSSLDSADFETNLRRAGTALSGSSFVHRRS